MILDRTQLIQALEAGGVPNAWEPFATQLDGARFTTVSPKWVREVWEAGVKALAANAPELVADGRPLYVVNGFNCRGHSLFIYAHGMIGFATLGASQKLDYDGVAFGWLRFLAEPRAENRFRSGPHRILWHIDHEGRFRTFEGGDGEEDQLTEGELKSIMGVYAQ